MLDQLEWLDLESKSAAFDKVGNLTVNIAYPDFITDDTQLDQYYNKLTFSASDYFTMISDLTPFNYYLQYSRITNNATVDHKDFLGAPGTVNAWYQVKIVLSLSLYIFMISDRSLVPAKSFGYKVEQNLC